jgi:hypothetical protein
MQSQPGSALHGLLALVAGTDEVEGRVRLQKEAYLLALKGYPHFRPKRFSFYYFGPYCRDISDALHVGVASHLIEERKDQIGAGCRYSYNLTDEGRTWLEAESDEYDRVVDVYRIILRSASWRTLELAASAIFFERSNEVSNRNDAFAKALGLKPECNDYKPDAAKLLHDLEL